MSLRDLLEKFGDSASLSGGFQISSAIDLSGQPLTFQVEHSADGQLHAKLLTAEAATLWEGELETTAAFPGVETFARRALGYPDDPRAEQRTASLAPARLPAPGEVWSMRVLVEVEGDEEIRYVSLNAKGQPYGAARVLPRSVFDSAFDEFEGSHRMKVHILEVESDTITYVRLDPAGESARHPPKTVPLPAFVGQFVAEPGHNDARTRRSGQRR